MIVLDASALLEILVGSAVGDEIAALIAARRENLLHVPHLAEVEAAQGLRRLVRQGVIGPARADNAIAELAVMPLERYAHAPLLGRVWELRENMSAYDAVYVALAEELDAELFTCDART